MTFTFIPPVPAEQIRRLPTRDVALLLLQHLASGTGFLQYGETMGSARQAFQGEPDTQVLVDRLSDAWSWLEAHALLSRVPSQSDAFRRLPATEGTWRKTPKASLERDRSRSVAGDHATAPPRSNRQSTQRIGFPGGYSKSRSPRRSKPALRHTAFDAALSADGNACK